MAKLIVQHEVDPGIAIVLTEVLPHHPSLARGWRGQCTECGKTMHRWHQDRAISAAQAHVDSHESSL